MLQLHTLGDIRLNTSGGELLPGRRKELVLLAYLARRSPRAVRREELIGLLWEARDDARARSSLRQALLQLRRAVGDGLVVDRETVQLAEGVVEMDARVFEEDARARRDREAVERWRGEFLPGAEDVGGEAYQTWLEGERETLRRRLSSVFEHLVSTATEAGDSAGALQWTERWAGLFSLDERPSLRWIEALHRAGRSDDAMTQRAAYVARLRRELGAEPSDEFERLTKGLGPAHVRSEPVVVRHPGSGAIFTPDLVGRDGPLAELAAAWREVQSGGTATVVVEGVEGVGKTLLCERFLQSIVGGGLVLRARAHEDARSEVWKSARDLLAPLAEAAGLGGATGHALAEVSQLVPPIAARFPNLPEPERSDSALPAAVSEVLGTIAEELPLAVFLDDLAWADQASTNLIVRLTRDRRSGVMLLVTARPEGLATSSTLADLCQVPGVRRLKLQPLGLPEIEALLRSMIALPSEECRALAPRLHAEAGGNPFYAAEIVAAMVDDGHLTLDASGIWRSSTRAGGSPLPLPSSIRDAVGRRLARLSASAHQVAGAAARLSEPCSRDRLRRDGNLSAESFEAALDELITRRILRPVSTHLDSGDTFEFAHPIIRRVARDRLSVSALMRTQRPKPWWRTRTAMLGATAFVVAAGTVAALSLRPSSAEIPVVAIGEINQRGDADTLGVSKSLVDMLATNLARVPSLRVVSNVRMYELLAALGNRGANGAAWAAAARRAGAGELVEGSLNRSGDGFRLDLRRVDLETGAVRAAYTVRGADPFDLVDHATSEIAADLGVPFGVLRFADVSTRSLVAYRFYEEGLRSYAIGDHRAAGRLFDAAVAEDSTFAMAVHYALTTRIARHQYASSAERAGLMRLADRATDRERLLIRSAWTNPNSPELVAIAETLAVRYPAEPDGHYLLGLARAGVGDFVGALPHLKRVVEMDSVGLRGATARCRACEALNVTVEAYNQADSSEAAERVTRDWLRFQSRSAPAWRGLARSLEAQGRNEEALGSMRNAIAISPGGEYDALYPAILRIRTGDFRGADELLRNLASNGSRAAQSEALWFLTISLRNQGRLTDALGAMRDPATSRDRRDTGALQHRAQVLFEMGRARESARLFDSIATRVKPQEAYPGMTARHRAWNLTHLATALAALADSAALTTLADSIEWWGARSAYGRDLRLHYHARGLLLAMRGQLEQATTAFRSAIFSPTTGYTRTNLELGRVLIALARPREAVTVLQSALRGELEASNLYVTRTELHELLGTAWQAAGVADSAIMHDRLVLDAWRNADPSFHARRDSVRARLATLTGSPDKSIR